MKLERKYFFRVSLGLGIAAVGLAAIPSVWAQELSPPSSGPDQFYRGYVKEIVKNEEENGPDLPVAGAFTEVVKVELTTGPKRGELLELNYGGVKGQPPLELGEKILVVAPNGVADQSEWYIFDRYRLPSLYLVGGIFIVLVIIFARWRGVTSLLGLLVTVAILIGYMVPQILAGANALITILLGSLVIAVVSIYLAHGFSRRTSVAVGSTLITICIALGLAMLFTSLVKLFGMGSEEAFYLQTAPVVAINLKGLLLGGIIIGTLGVLDDITTAQAAAVDEIAKANPALTRRDLLQRGLSVGREHITSLVNTLALAYAGASFPALLLFTVYQRPFWVVLNTEVIAEELVRTLVGSIALMCAVPITTALAALFLSTRADTYVEKRLV